MGACRIEFFDVPAFDVLEISNLRGGEGGMSYRKFYLSIYGNVELTGCKKVEPIVLRVSIYRYIEISNLRGRKGGMSYRKFRYADISKYPTCGAEKVEYRIESFICRYIEVSSLRGAKRWKINVVLKVSMY